MQSQPSDAEMTADSSNLVSRSRRKLHRVVWSLFGRVLIRAVVRRFKDSSARVTNISEAVDLAFRFESLGVTIKPSQVREEIHELAQEVEELRPRVLLEIGTFNGGTLYIFSRAADSDALIISADLPGGLFGGGSPNWMVPFLKSFPNDRQSLRLLRANSHDSKTLEEIKRIIGTRGIDFLFIDGDHTYEGVKRDFEMYSPLVNPGGMIAFHDTQPHSVEGVEVSRFWDEVKVRFKSRDIVKDRSQAWAGIGVLRV